MKEKKTLSTRLSELIQKNSFLKIISVLLAVIVWIYILYDINPVNNKEFNRVSVDLSYEGSIPERNGYMYLLTDTNLTVSVNVSGSRSELLNLTSADIKASLNLDPITTSGTHSVAVNISTKNKSLEIVDYSPKSFTIEFAPIATRTLPVEWQPAGALPDGYNVSETSVSPKEVVIFGPASTVESIERVYVSMPVTNVREETSGLYDISIVNKNGENVDRRYLTISDTKAEANLSVYYQKELKPVVTVTNTSGGNESDYITVTLDTEKIIAKGSERILASMDTISLGTIDTSLYTKNTTVEFVVPEIDGVTFDKQTVNAAITFGSDLSTKDITFSASAIVAKNFPENKKPSIKNSVTVRIRANKADLKNLTSSSLVCEINYEDKLPDGSYPVVITYAGSTIAFGVVGAPALKASSVVY